MPRHERLAFCYLASGLTLTVHQLPSYPVGQGTQNAEATMRQAYDSVMSALVLEYQGFVENPDQ